MMVPAGRMTATARADIGARLPNLDFKSSPRSTGDVPGESACIEESRQR